MLAEPIHTGFTGAVVITGASTGIGEACALHLDGLGFKVFAGIRKKEDGCRLQEQASPRLSPILIDVTDSDSIAAAAEIVRRATGEVGLAGLINNAGVAIGGPLEFIPLEKLRRQLEVNVVGQIAVTQAFMPMLRMGRGRVINMGSIGGRVATPFMGPYNASKFALEALTDSLRLELQQWGIEVSIIEPGVVATPIWEKSLQEGHELREMLPDAAVDLYRPMIELVLSKAEKRTTTGISPEIVAQWVYHALIANPPRTRYIIGQDALIQVAMSKVMPDRLRDKLIAQKMRIPSVRRKAAKALAISPRLIIGMGIGLALGKFFFRRKR